MCQTKIPKSCWLCDEQKKKKNRRCHGWKKRLKKIEILMTESRIRYQFNGVLLKKKKYWRWIKWFLVGRSGNDPKAVTECELRANKHWLQ